MKRSLFLILFLFSAVIGFSSQLEEARITFDQANKAYESQSYEEARDLYLSLYKDYSSFEYYYNLGNTYYKLNDIPSSILFYEKAMKIQPNDDDLNTNLTIANQKVKDKIDAIPLSNLSDFWKSIVAEKNLKFWTVACLLFVFVAFLFFGLFYWKKKKNAYMIIGVLSILFSGFFYFLGSTTMSRMKGNTEAIIFSPKVDVLNQPNGETTEFVIHEGTKVILKEVSGDWAEIKIVNGNVGWIRTSEYKEI